MRQRGHRVIIVASPGSDLLDKASQENFTTVPMSFAQRDWPVTLKRLLKLYRDVRPDVVNTHSSKDSWIAGIATRCSSLRPALVRTRHLSTPVAKGPLNSLLYQRLPHHIVTTGEVIREQLITRNHVLPQKVVSIPTGVDLERFDPSHPFKDIRQELSLAPQTPLIGTVSVLRSWKGHTYLIQAAEQIQSAFPQARFLLVGEGGLRPLLEEEIRQRGLTNTVLLTGHREDVSDVLASLDILVHPSYANEGIPQTLLQGLAMQTPIICSDLKPQLEVIKQDETGLVVPAQDPQALGRAIATLLRDPDLGKSLAHRGRATIEKYSLESMLDMTEQMYGHLKQKKEPGFNHPPQRNHAPLQSP